MNENENKKKNDSLVSIFQPSPPLDAHSDVIKIQLNIERGSTKLWLTPSMIW